MTESAPVESSGPETAPKAVKSTSPPRLHPVLFTLFPILSLFAANIGELEWRDALLPFLLALVLSVLLTVLLGKALRDKLRGAVLATLFLTAFFAFGRFYPLRSFLRSTVMLFNPEAVTANVDWLLLVPWFLLVIALAIPCIRSRRNFAPLTALLNVIGAVMVVQPAFVIALHWRQIAAVGVPVPSDRDAVTGFPKSAFAASGKPAATSAAPDIYFILLDAYGRQDVLKKYYDLDNAPFVEGLEKRGFYVAPRSRPNYEQTVCSIGSTLNMRYLDDLTQRYGRVVNNKGIISELIDQNAVAAFVRKKGYRFVSIASDFPMTAIPSADISWSKPEEAKSALRYLALNSFEVLLLDATPLELVPMATRTNYDEHRDLLLANFQALRDAPRLTGRNFFFAHILAPHPPFVFGPEGQPVTPNRPYTISDGSDWMRHGERSVYRKGYADQLRYTNICVLKTVDAILARSTVRPVIIIQGDHGPRMFLDWESIARSDIGETYGNLCAYYLPDGKASQVFYPTITPVNSFRLLFDHYFDAKLERLPDRSYFSPLQHPFDFTDVTDKAP